MSRTANGSRGEALANRLRRGCQAAQRAPRPGTRQLPVLHGVTPRSLFTHLQENVLVDGRGFLIESRRVFMYGDEIVLEVGEADHRRLVTIAADGYPGPGACSWLANLFICEQPPASEDGTPIQYAPPRGFVSLLLNNEVTQQELPRIQTYSNRPVFDKHLQYRGVGWHADDGILVHGPEIEPQPRAEIPAGERALDRLPPHLARLLGDFCFGSDADVANAIGAMVTGMMLPVFRASGKPILLIDGNQPGVGKTFFARVMGIVFDGNEPVTLHYTADDEELAKRICATLRGTPQSIMLIDNAKVRSGAAITSAVIEAHSMAPQISLRILGQSATLTRPNDLLWCLTMNSTKTSPDLVSRGLPVRFYHEGEPGERDFAGRDSAAYAAEHRVEILGELAGMVIRWTQQGRPRFDHRHRCGYWASVIGGILQVNRLSEFLSNLQEAACEFNTALDELAALAEAAIGLSQGVIYMDTEQEDDA